MNAALNHHDWLLAREVIREACARYGAGRGVDLPELRDEVIAERWPARGNGGVAMSQRRTAARVRCAITAFYS